MSIYRKEWGTFKQEYRKIFLFILLASFIVTIGCYFYLSMNPDMAKQILGKIKSMIPENVSSSASENFYYYFSFFFAHNSLAALYTLILGFIPLVILPALCALLTCSTISAVLVLSNNPGLLLLTGILPHGIVELPALILSSTLGVYLSLTILKSVLYNKREEYSIKAAVGKVARTFLFVVLPMLLLAAVLEALVTPIVLHSFYF